VKESEIEIPLSKERGVDGRNQEAIWQRAKCSVPFAVLRLALTALQGVYRECRTHD